MNGKAEVVSVPHLRYLPADSDSQQHLRLLGKKTGTCADTIGASFPGCSLQRSEEFTEHSKQTLPRPLWDEDRVLHNGSYRNRFEMSRHGGRSPVSARSVARCRRGAEHHSCHTAPGQGNQPLTVHHQHREDKTQPSGSSLKPACMFTSPLNSLLFTGRALSPEVPRVSAGHGVRCRGPAPGQSTRTRKQSQGSPLSTASPAARLDRLCPPTSRTRTNRMAGLAAPRGGSARRPRARKTQRLDLRAGKKNLPPRSAATDSATPRTSANGRFLYHAASCQG